VRVNVVAVVALSIAAASMSPVAADDDPIRGYMTEIAGTLYGRVVDDDGEPLAGVEVQVVPRRGTRHAIKTDGDGRYQLTVGPGGVTVFIRGEGRFSEQTMVASRRQGEQDEVDIHDTVPAASPAVIIGSDRLIPEYSESAVDHDAWTRAWLLLDVDARGVVTRVKLLHKPGYDLDTIAIRTALGLRFKPARNRVGAAVGSVVVWTFEWPSPTYLVKVKGTRVSRLPPQVKGVPCRGNGPSHARWLRDCTLADVSEALDLPWLALKTAAPAPQR
jgi:hypothetical protein